MWDEVGVLVVRFSQHTLFATATATAISECELPKQRPHMKTTQDNKPA